MLCYCAAAAAAAGDDFLLDAKTEIYHGAAYSRIPATLRDGLLPTEGAGYAETKTKALAGILFWSSSVLPFFLLKGGSAASLPSPSLLHPFFSP